MDIDEEVTLYTYTCWDGVVRTRCMAHIARRGQLGPVPWKPLVKKEVKARRSCVMCFGQWIRRGALVRTAAGEGPRSV